jgi:hypothetical protein
MPAPDLKDEIVRFDRHPFNDVTEPLTHGRSSFEVVVGRCSRPAYCVENSVGEV